jgi:hypothetical protein
MSFFPEIQAAAAEAEENLAFIGGMSATATGNTLLAGQTVALTGVYGRPSVEFVPLVTGGYRKRTVVRLSITRAQLAVPPGPNTKLTRIDLSPHVTYNVEHLDTQDALHWVFTVVNFAG